VTAWRRLVLWDIDGTLLSARGAGRRALGRALERVYGTAGHIEGYDFRGKTDPRIVLDLMGAAGLADADIRAGFDECFDFYARGLAVEIGDGSGVKVLPGVAELVRRLHTTPGIIQGLLTGNIEEGARIKLEPTGLHPFFRTGAYGSDHADRRQLPSLAARRAEALVGHRFAPGVVHNTEHVLSLALRQRVPVTLAPEEHAAFAWLTWREAAARCFSWSNRDAIAMLGEGAVIT